MKRVNKSAVALILVLTIFITTFTGTAVFAATNDFVIDSQG